MPSTENPKPERSRIGLCADCEHMTKIVAARGRTFYMCRRGLTEPEFPKYPRLPVLVCGGHQPADPAP